MTTLRGLAIIPASMLLLASCADDGSTTDSTAVNVTSAVTDPPGATTDTTETTETTHDTDTTASPAADGTVQIDVVIGIDSGPDRVEQVPLGTEVTMTITSPNTDDEIHVHGIDLEQDVAAGESVTFTFVVDTVGDIEVESHVTEDVIVVIEVL